MSSIYILIPVFKRLEHTINFIESCKQYITESKTFVIIDDSPEFEHFFHFKNNKDIIVLKGTGNLWWGGSINLGMEYLFSMNLPEKTIIIWANNDTIIDKSLYEEQKKYLELNPTAFFHPRVFDISNKKEVKDCGNLKSWAPLRCNYIIYQKKELASCNLVSARFLMSYLKNFKKVGLIAKNLPHYNGDWDYSLRAEKVGLTTYLVKDAICYVDFSPTGIKYEEKISFLKFLDGLFFNIKSPQNIRYKYQLYRNYKSSAVSTIFTFIEFLKTIIKWFYLKHILK
jgi:N-acetylglucosaminyl-diphospho-decaprenol L-rhamnosyltransferase